MIGGYQVQYKEKKMAQRLIHYLLGEIFSEEIELKNKKRFLLGSIMSDAYMNLKDRDKTHFANRTEETTYFDFNLFREKFDRQINEDSLYLGYYMHLVEDVFYRQFIHRDEFRITKSQKEISMLHNDYHILNSYIVSKFNCQNILQEKINLDSEKIMEIAEFRIEGFLKDFAGDFSDKTQGETVFITENMLDQFIEEYVPVMLEELRAVKKDKSILVAKDYKWKRGKK